jgi:hypothetical protein
MKEAFGAKEMARVGMTHIQDVSPEEEGRRWGEKEYIDAMHYMQGAEFFPPQ